MLQSCDALVAQQEADAPHGLCNWLVVAVREMFIQTPNGKQVAARVCYSGGIMLDAREVYTMRLLFRQRWSVCTRPASAGDAALPVAEAPAPRLFQKCFAAPSQSCSPSRLPNRLGVVIDFQRDLCVECRRVRQQRCREE